MNPSNIYPRTGDTQTVYLNQVVTDPSILVGDYTMYNDFVHDPVDFEKNNVLYHYPVNHDRLVIGKFCSIACGAKFLFNSANHSLQSLSTYPFPIFFEEWGLERSRVAKAWDKKGDIVIGNDVWIGYEAVILAGVTVGDGAIIGARAVITKDIPLWAVSRLSRSESGFPRTKLPRCWSCGGGSGRRSGSGPIWMPFNQDSWIKSDDLFCGNVRAVPILNDTEQEIQPSETVDFRGLYSCLGLFPVVQLWQLSFKVGSDLLRGPGLIGHMTFQEIQQFLKARVNEFPVGIAPLAVLLVEGTARLPADIGVLQGHAAALADQLPGRAQQGVDGDIKQPGEQLQSFCVGHRFTGLPAGNRLTGHMHFFRQLFLGESPLGAQFQKDFFGIHVDHHLARILPQREQKAKQLAVAPILLCSRIRRISI